MNNYKIKVNNEAESKEAQELFFELGYGWYGKEKKVSYLHCISSGEFTHLLAWSTGGFDDVIQMGCGSEDAEEITLPQLRDLVATHRKPTEQGLISGADAKLAWAKGEDVEFHYADTIWAEIPSCAQLSIFDDEEIKFRLKPSTITLNVEIPAPFEPKDGEEAWCLDGNTLNGYKKVICDDFIDSGIGFWRTEEEIKKVVTALRGGIKG